MRAIQADRFEANFRGLRVVELPRPEPEAGEVLLEVAVAPVNPADAMMTSGTYIRNTTLPFVPGLVGVGMVREAGGGLMPKLLRGRRVVFAATKGKSGTWAEFAVAPATLCAPVPGDLSDAAAVNLLANGTTAVALVSIARRDGHRGLAITAAGSEVAGMVAIEARRRGLTIVGVVRREEQRAALVAAGRFDAVVVAMGVKDRDRLAAAFAQWQVTVAVDAIAGPMIELLMEALPDGGVVRALGRLSGENASFDVMRQLVGRGMRLEGFAIDRWIGSRSLPAQLWAVRRAGQLVRQAGGGTRTGARFTLDQAVAVLPGGACGDGKTLIIPGA